MSAKSPPAARRRTTFSWWWRSPRFRREVRGRQGLRRGLRRPLPVHRDRLSLGVWLHPGTLAGTATRRRVGADPGPGRARGRYPRATDRHAAACRTRRDRTKDQSACRMNACIRSTHTSRASSTCRHHAVGDRALLRALQRPRTRQMGEDARAGRTKQRQRGRSRGHRGGAIGQCRACRWMTDCPSPRLSFPRRTAGGSASGPAQAQQTDPRSRASCLAWASSAWARSDGICSRKIGSMRSGWPARTASRPGLGVPSPCRCT